MAYRLAVDVGTASIGLAAFKLNDRGEPASLIYHRVRIFQEPLLPARKGGVGEPKKAARRLVRQQRRQHSRRARRLRKLAYLSPLLGIDPRQVRPDAGQDIHRMRAEAAARPIGLDELLLVFIKIAKRRGFAGEFRVKAEKDKGEVETGIYMLQGLMAEAGCATIGQYLWHRYKKGLSLRLKEAEIYASRDMVREEFDRIWETQAAHHAVMRGRHGGQALRDVFSDAIFHQRPLRSPATMVGMCPLEPTLKRAPRAQLVQSLPHQGGRTAPAQPAAHGGGLKGKRR